MIDIGKAANGLAIIRNIYAGIFLRGGQLTADIVRRFPTTDPGTVGTYLARPSMAGACHWRDTEGVHVAIAGNRSSGDAIDTAKGYVDESRIDQAGGFNWTFAEAAKSLWSFGLFDACRGANQVWLYGHSAGGAVAEVITWLVRRTFPGVNVVLHTFGSPSPARRGVPWSDVSVSRHRWMAQNDPAPLIPWADVGERGHLFLYLASGALLSGVSGEPRPNLFVQPTGGLRLNGGAPELGELPTMSVDPQVQMQAWLDNDEFARTCHSVDTYYRKLVELQTRFGNVIEQPRTSARQTSSAVVVDGMRLAPPTGAVPRVGLVVPLLVRPDSITLDVARRVWGDVVIQGDSMAFLKINPKLAFRMVKVGNAWHVTLGEVIVIVADSPHTVKTIVKRLNGMLRAVGTTNTVFSGAFLTALGDWFLAAATDPNYCLPLMRVDP